MGGPLEVLENTLLTTAVGEVLVEVEAEAVALVDF